MISLLDIVQRFPEARLYGDVSPLIKGISSHSKKIEANEAFLVKKGSKYNGEDYIEEALSRGAVALLTESYHPCFSTIPQLVLPIHVEAEGRLASMIYGKPSEHLFTVGITGTNGKTTTSYMLHFLLESLMGPTGLIGTIECRCGSQSLPAERTTPDVFTNHKLLAQMVQEKCQHVVMEVTSHGLDQGRVSGIDFDVAVFTNLTQDHLDYHLTMDRYLEAKRQLFLKLNERSQYKKNGKYAVVNQDSEVWRTIIEGSEASVLTYGIDEHADLQATDLQYSSGCSHFKVNYKGEKVVCTIPFVGKFNVYNCLAAIAVLLVKGIDLNLISQQLAMIPPVPGRLEQVHNRLNKKIYVDFAHTPDGIKKAMEALKQPSGQGKLFVLFGAGGDRDQAKRTGMAEVCEACADFSIVTSDNPRSEDPLEICQQIARGFSRQDAFRIEVNRRKAIELGVSLLGPEDVLLVAGRGHESHQIFNAYTIPFLDKDVVQEVCNQLFIEASR